MLTGNFYKFPIQRSFNLAPHYVSAVEVKMRYDFEELIFLVYTKSKKKNLNLDNCPLHRIELSFTGNYANGN
jgi:hypothetical protein